MIRHLKVIFTIVALFVGCHKQTKAVSIPVGDVVCGLSPQAEHPSIVKDYVYIDNTLSDVEIRSIMHAMNDWAVATGGRVEYGPIKLISRDDASSKFIPEDADCDIDRPSRLYFKSVELEDEEIVKADLQNKIEHKDSRITLALTRTICEKSVVKIASRRVYGLNEKQTIGLIQHELGHVFLISHHDELIGHTVMASLLDNYAKCITKQDVELFCQMQNCEE